MDASSISNAAGTLAALQRVNDVQMTVLKKALDVQAQGAVTLIDALPQPAASLPANLGRHVNTVA
ncbi:hypothetical protein GALL_346920 [mine drainage metagenome]|uniref:Motility protein n=1 Tax=mine drainage metagenome TaxID=410659 RepID=A0A1J5QJN1_9ZZZZ